MVTIEIPNSSAVTQVGYDLDTLTLSVRYLNGRTYWYSRVPPRVFDSVKALLAIDGSVGNYIAKFVKPIYPCDIKFLRSTDATSFATQLPQTNILPFVRKQGSTAQANTEAPLPDWRKRDEALAKFETQVKQIRQSIADKYKKGTPKPGPKQ
jgi:hypothetical protein